MKINMKKVLLTGTALVAVAAFGSAANAQTVTLTGAGVWGVDGNGVTAGAGSSQNVVMGANTLLIQDVAGRTDGGAAGFELGNVTSTTGALSITQDAAATSNMLVTIGSFNGTGAANVTITGSDVDFNAAVNVTRELKTGGALVVTNAAEDDAAHTLSLTIGGDTSVTGASTITGGAIADATTTLTLKGQANAFAGGLTLNPGTGGAVLNFQGGTDTKKGAQTFAGNIAGTGTINVGTIGAGAINANTTVNGTIAGANLNVASGSTLTVTNTTNLTTAINSDGTFNANGTGAYTITGAATYDGTFTARNESTRVTTKTVGTGTDYMTTLATLSKFGTDASATTVGTTTNVNLYTPVTAGNGVEFGADHGANGINTVNLNIGRGEFSAVNNDKTAPTFTLLTATAATGAVNNGIVRLGLADNDTYSFDNGNIVRVIDGAAAAGTDWKAALAANTVVAGTGRLVIENSALARLSAFDTDGTTWLATAAAGGDDRDLTVRVDFVNPNGVLASGYAASVASNMMYDLTTANYGSRWGEQAEVNEAAPNAANGVGKGALGQIQGNAANLANGNVLREARNNLLAARTAAAATDVAESLTTTVDGGHVMGALNATNGTFSVANDRLAALRTGSTGMAAGNGAGHRFWLQGFGATADQDRRDGVDGYDADTWGFAVGLDTETLHSNGVLGVAFSYGDTDVDSKNANRTDTEIDTYQITLYGSYDLDRATFINGMLAYSWHDVDTLRHDVGGIAGINARGAFDAHQWTAEASVGRDYAYDSMILTPSLLAHYTRYSADNYTETGAGNASLIVDQDSLSKFELGVGVNAAWNVQTASGANFEPSLHAGYRYDFIGDEVETTNRFVGGGAAFNAEGADPSKHSFNVGGALSLYSHSGWEFTANYDYDFKSDYDAHSGYVRAGVKF